MLLDEIIKEVGMTKRAVKYYEEKGLLSVDKDSSGYRNYSMQDVKTFKKISVYRKLGIGIKDIRILLEKDDKSILLHIYQQMRYLITKLSKMRLTLYYRGKNGEIT